MQKTVPNSTKWMMHQKQIQPMWQKYTQYINNTANNNYHPTKSPLTPFQIKYQIEPYQ